MKRILVGVIDSGVNRSDPFLVSRTIESYSCKEGIITESQNNRNPHGTEVIKILYREVDHIDVISIQILNENNKGTVGELLHALQYCIDRKVDIINVSLGFVPEKNRDLSALMQLCQKALDYGIAIIAANGNHNDKGNISYPANFRCVIAIDFDPSMEYFMELDEESNCVRFSSNQVFMPEHDRNRIKQGNSFLVPVITGLYCNYIRHTKKKKYNDYRGFFQFLNRELIQKQSKKIFYDKKSRVDESKFTDCNIVYLSAGELSSDDNNIVSFYSNKANVSVVDILEYIDMNLLTNADYLFFGNISYDTLRENRKTIYSLMKFAVRNVRGIITIMPFISTYGRTRLRNQYQVEVISFYM